MPTTAGVGRSTAERVPATILFAEDEAGIRQLLAELLREEGYEVLAAADGKQALQTARAHRGGIDLVVCDVVMPALDGVGLISALREERPDLPVLFISGNTFDALEQGGLADEPYLQKPFRPALLVERVRELLRRPAARVIELTPRRA